MKCTICVLKDEKIKELEAEYKKDTALISEGNNAILRLVSKCKELKAENKRLQDTIAKLSITRNET